MAPVPDGVSDVLATHQMRDSQSSIWLGLVSDQLLALPDWRACPEQIVRCRLGGESFFSSAPSDYVTVSVSGLASGAVAMYSQARPPVSATMLAHPTVGVKDTPDLFLVAGHTGSRGPQAWRAIRRHGSVKSRQPIPPFILVVIWTFLREVEQWPAFG